MRKTNENKQSNAKTNSKKDCGGKTCGKNSKNCK